jgi:hypothetical protein
LGLRKTKASIVLRMASNIEKDLKKIFSPKTQNPINPYVKAPKKITKEIRIPSSIRLNSDLEVNSVLVKIKIIILIKGIKNVYQDSILIKWLNIVKKRIKNEMFHAICFLFNICKAK